MAIELGKYIWKNFKLPNTKKRRRKTSTIWKLGIVFGKFYIFKNYPKFLYFTNKKKHSSIIIPTNIYLPPLKKS